MREKLCCESSIRRVNKQCFANLETVFDSQAHAIVHGSVDALPEQDPTTFEASQSMASGVVYDDLSSKDNKIDDSRFKEIGCTQRHVSQRQ